ncbi:ATPase associated with various cellular activities AAA_5 [Bacillus methanolicus PB1]|uniref:ATPase associated with various cellular activities AAA_5 n=1 Tax=Bacillus methanolicus PB1 TaxID=997296 RepID=I3DV77_BACMT|nr:MoxR family ATPase [Bacillus methanolicus]EIJ78148.1 ATPase associated with various cellular activities AAA_5 [Bacillus methanolicus PB1]
MNEQVRMLQEELQRSHYVVDKGLATVVHLAQRLARPLLLEGPAGVGKTALAKALAAVRSVNLVRLQCYEGLDASQALYDWDYPKQLLTARTVFTDGTVNQDALYSESFLIERPLLRALRERPAPVLLIDEIDRADEEFEALLLEFLSEFQITIPEMGTFCASEPPIVILTSNRTRDLSDALRRRCLYIWVDYPAFEQEAAIISLHVPHIAPKLVKQIVYSVRRLRKLSLFKPPGLAESIDFAQALTELGAHELNDEVIQHTLGCLLKTQEDMELLKERGFDLLWNI